MSYNNINKVFLPSKVIVKIAFLASDFIFYSMVGKSFVYIIKEIISNPIGLNARNKKTNVIRLVKLCQTFKFWLFDLFFAFKFIFFYFMNYYLLYISF